MTQMIPAWVDGTLVPVEKMEAHRRGLKHPAVSVFILRGPEILLQRRAMEKYHTPGLWANTCCTHAHWGEDASTCATRRLGEELGIDDMPVTFRDQVEYRADVGKDLIEHEVVDIFCANAPENMVVAPNPSEVMDTRWTTLDALRADIARDPDAFTPWLRIYLDKFAERIFGDALVS